MTKASRGRQPLGRDVIVAAARRIADAEGLDDLTLRRLARELGTGQASLYRHIADRAELLALLAENLAAGTPLVSAAPDDASDADDASDGSASRAAPADRTADPAGTVVRQWQAAYDYLAAHPWGPRLIADGRHHARAGARVVAHGTALLRAAGLDAEDATRAYRALWHLTLGHLLNAHAVGHPADRPQPAGPGPEEDTAADFGWALRRLVAGILDTKPSPH